MKTRPAFSLIEVLVAVALFAVGAASLLQTFHVATRTAARQRHLAAGLHAAEQVMEAMLLRAIDDRVFTTTALFCFDSHAVMVDCLDGPGVYEVEVLREPTTLPGFFELTVTSSWRQDGQPQHIVLKTRRT